MDYLAATYVTPPNLHGVAFSVRLVRRGDPYGLGFGVKHDKEDPLVEFYDLRYTFYDTRYTEGFTNLGQFVVRYPFRLLASRLAPEIGLDLDGARDEQYIGAPDMPGLLAALRRELALS